MARKDVEAIQIHVPIGAREKIKEYVETVKGMEISEYIRQLIQADMTANGTEIDLKVNRGGYRERADSDD